MTKNKILKPVTISIFTLLLGFSFVAIHYSEAEARRGGRANRSAIIKVINGVPTVIGVQKTRGISAVNGIPVIGPVAPARGGGGGKGRGKNGKGGKGGKG